MIDTVFDHQEGTDINATQLHIYEQLHAWQQTFFICTLQPARLLCLLHRRKPLNMSAVACHMFWPLSMSVHCRSVEQLCASAPKSQHYARRCCQNRSMIWVPDLTLKVCHQEQHSVSPPAQNARGQKWLKLKVVTPDGHAMNAPHEPSHTSGLLPKWHQCLPWPTVKRRSLGRLCPASSILPTSQVWRLWPDPLTPTRLWRQHTILSRIIPIAFLAFHRLFFFCLLLQNFAI